MRHIHSACREGKRHFLDPLRGWRIEKADERGRCTNLKPWPHWGSSGKPMLCYRSYYSIDLQAIPLLELLNGCFRFWTKPTISSAWQPISQFK